MRIGRLMAAAAVAFGASIAAHAEDSDLAAQRSLVKRLEAERVELVEKLAPTVVCVFPRGSRAGGGSGVLIDADGYGLTNYHVIAGLGEERQGEGGRSDGKLYPLEVLGFDPGGDLAMFHLTADGPLPFAPLGDSDALRVGDWTLAMGNPFLLSEDFTPTVTFGIVSGLHRYLAGQGRALIYTDCIEINTSINPGNSGGPLFNMGGAVVGINGRIGIEERGRVNVGVGYAISAGQIRRLVPFLRAGLVAQHATLGATVFDQAHRVVVVDQILEESDAYRAGLRLADRVLEFDGEPIRSANQLANLVGSYPARWPVRMKIRRGDEDQVLSFRLDALPLPRKPKMPADIPPEVLARMPKPLSGTNWEANAREVIRLLGRARAALLGGASPPAAWEVVLSRRLSGGEPRALTFTEYAKTPLRRSPDEQPTPQTVEQITRWGLFPAPDAINRDDWQALGGDLVAGSIATVLEHKYAGGPTVRLSLDEQSGRLLRIEFKDDRTGKRARYDYADYRVVDGLRLPHRRELSLDDVPYFEEHIESYRVLDLPAPRLEPASGD